MDMGIVQSLTMCIWVPLPYGKLQLGFPYAKFTMWGYPYAYGDPGNSPYGYMRGSQKFLWGLPICIR